MGLIIHKTTEGQHFQTENITREAFWNIYKPGCDEHLVLHNIRKSRCYIPELDLVSVFEQQIIGHAITTRARVIDSLDNEKEVLCLGPIAVLPAFQKKGVGIKLMEHSISEAKKMGFAGIILFGNPDYYHRFGFKNAQEYGITTRDLQNFEPFMALELQYKGLENVKGRFLEDDVFHVNPEDLIEFEKQFPPKEKLITSTQLH
jgi:predicted N-acetyltransferase YhbS